MEETDPISAWPVDSYYQSESDAHLGEPLALAIDQQNNLYVSDVEKGFVFKVDKTGATTLVAGTGKSGDVRDGVPATKANLVAPLKVIVDDEGNLYIADGAAFRVYKVDTKGILTTVAGTGVEGPGGDGGPALAATLASPYGLAVRPDHSLFILDTINSRIRKVDPDGIIRMIAGTGEKGYGGDGGPAATASLHSPDAIATDQAGNLFVADSYNYRIRKIDNRGIISTVAGTGASGYNADGISATTAWLGLVVAITFDDHGNLFIADLGAGRIRRLDKQGAITTVAGCGPGKAGRTNEGIPATNAILNEPYAVAVDHEGTLYVADWAVKYSKTRVSKINSAGIITTLFTDTPPVSR